MGFSRQKNRVMMQRLSGYSLFAFLSFFLLKEREVFLRNFLSLDEVFGEWGSAAV